MYIITYLEIIMEQKKLGLSFRGGAGRCFSYVGFIKALEENDIKVDFIIGSSGGALVAVGYGLGLSSKEMINLTKDIKAWKYVGLAPIRERFPLSTKLIKKKFISIMGDGKRFEDLKIPVAVQTTDMETGKTVIFEKGEILNPLVGSMAIPGLVHPVKIDDHILLDGDLSSGYGIDHLKKMGADVAIGLSADGFNPLFSGKEFNNPIKATTAAILNLVTTVQKQSAELDPPDLLFESMIGDIQTVTGLDKVDELLEYGYKRGIEQMDEIKKLLS